MMIRSLVFLIFLSLGMAYNITHGVIALTEDDFPKVLEDYPNLLIKFYTPWCHHCKKLAPIYTQLAEELKTALPQVQLADIDLDAHKKIQAKYRVNSYPTLLFIKNGKQIKFDGSRTKEFISKWLHTKVKDPITTIQPSQLQTLKTDGNINIVLYGGLTSPQAQILSKLSIADNYNNYYNVQNSGHPEGSVQIFRPFAGSVTNNKVDNSIKNWISMFDRPLVFPFDERCSGEVFSQKRNAILFFTPEGEQAKEISNSLQLAAAQWKISMKKKLIFAEISHIDQSYTSLSDYLKFSPKKYPLVYLKVAQKLKYFYPGRLEELSKDTIIGFIRSIENGKIKPAKWDTDTRINKKAETAQASTVQGTQL